MTRRLKPTFTAASGPAPVSITQMNSASGPANTFVWDETAEEEPMAIYNQVALGNDYQFNVKNTYTVVAGGKGVSKSGRKH